jgi:hypothetical protein
MRDHRTIQGRWWAQGDDQPSHPGTLTFEPEQRLTLRVRIPRDPGRGLLASLLDLDDPALAVQPVIHGEDHSGKPVTLFGCTCDSRNSTAKCTTIEIAGLAALVNSRRSSWADECFRAVEVEYSLLHNWIDQRFIPAREAPDGKGSFLLPTDILIDLLPGTRLRITAGLPSNTSISRPGHQFNPRVLFHFPAPLNIEKVLSGYTGVLQNLLCLLTGGTIFYDRISLYESDPFEGERPTPSPSADLLRCCSGVTTAERELPGLMMLSNYAELAGHLPGIVQKWFELHESLESVVGLFMVVRSQRVRTMQTRFLLLAQALEVYHARSAQFTSTEMRRAGHKERVRNLVGCVPEEDRAWLKEKLAYSNQKTLAVRIAEVLAAHPQEASRLIAGIPGFAEKVKNTRNYYTHYGQEALEEGKVAQGRELVRISLALEGLIGACLLKEIGLQGKPLERLLSRYACAKGIDLDGAYGIGSNAPDHRLKTGEG